jgi:diguanylate cyclase (GGDEF)-like protein
MPVQDLQSIIDVCAKAPFAFAIYDGAGQSVFATAEFNDLLKELPPEHQGLVSQFVRDRATRGEGGSELEFGTLGVLQITDVVSHTPLWLISHKITLTVASGGKRYAFLSRNAFLVAAKITPKFAIILCNLERVREVNQTFGMEAGDKLLDLAADRMATLAGNAFLVSRTSADEFAILVRGVQDITGVAASLAEDLIEAMTRPFMVGDEIIRVGMSVGVAVSNFEDSSPETIFRYATLALFNAKRSGTSQIRHFDPILDFYARERHEIERDISRALVLHQFHIVYQPLFDARTKKVCGGEALIRWVHPEHGEIRPTRFIPIAEEAGLIGRIGEWMIAEACKCAAQWPSHISVSINVSPIEIRDRGLLERVKQALVTSGLAPERLELEITEGVLLHDNANTLATLRDLKELGVRIVLDDFGTGYSSLSYLRSFHFDRVKIDQSFVRQMQDSVEASAVIQAILGLCAELKIPVVAEGVETEAQMIDLQARGCEILQGYFLGRPVPEEAFTRQWLKGRGTC